MVIFEVTFKISLNFHFPRYLSSANDNILADILISPLSIPKVMRRSDR